MSSVGAKQKTPLDAFLEENQKQKQKKTAAPGTALTTTNLVTALVTTDLAAAFAFAAATTTTAATYTTTSTTAIQATASVTALEQAAIVAQVGQQLQKIVKKLHDALKVQGKEHEPGLRQKLVRALRLQKLLAPTIPVALQACVPALTQAAQIRAAKAATEILNNFTSFNSLEQTRALIRAEAQIQTPEQAHDLETLELIVAYTLVQRFGSDSSSG
jgi:hypothetical protein